MAESSIPITAGTGTNVRTYQVAALTHDQYVREARATAESESFWTAATTASTSQIAADASRLGILMVNNSTGRIYIRFDSTAPTSATNGHHWFLEPGERWELPDYLATLAISVLAQIASGHLVTHLSTAA